MYHTKMFISSQIDSLNERYLRGCRRSGVIWSMSHLVNERSKKVEPDSVQPHLITAIRRHRIDVLNKQRLVCSVTASSAGDGSNVRVYSLRTAQ